MARFFSSNLLSNHLTFILSSVVGEENDACVATVKDDCEHKIEDIDTSKPRILTV